MLCPVCTGSGAIVTFRGGIRYWPCVCAGAGVLVQFGPASIRTRGKRG